MAKHVGGHVEAEGGGIGVAAKGGADGLVPEAAAGSVEEEVASCFDLLAPEGGVFPEGGEGALVGDVDHALACPLS